MVNTRPATLQQSPVPGWVGGCQPGGGGEALVSEQEGLQRAGGRADAVPLRRPAGDVDCGLRRQASLAEHRLPHGGGGGRGGSPLVLGRGVGQGPM